MERWALRKRMRQVHRILLDGRVALEKVSERMRDKAVRDMLFILACRRLIMMNLLDRELSTLSVRVEPTPQTAHFDVHLHGEPATAATNGGDLLRACEAEEHYLLSELKDLKFQPGVRDRTRNLLSEVIREVEEDLNDLRFLTGTLRPARA